MFKYKYGAKRHTGPTMDSARLSRSERLLRMDIVLDHFATLDTRHSVIGYPILFRRTQQINTIFEDWLVLLIQ